jgi:hypothetical protein
VSVVGMETAMKVNVFFANEHVFMGNLLLRAGLSLQLLHSRRFDSLPSSCTMEALLLAARIQSFKSLRSKWSLQ